MPYDLKDFVKRIEGHHSILTVRPSKDMYAVVWWQWQRRRWEVEIVADNPRANVWASTWRPWRCGRRKVDGESDHKNFEETLKTKCYFSFVFFCGLWQSERWSVAVDSRALNHLSLSLVSNFQKWPELNRSTVGYISIQGQIQCGTSSSDDMKIW